MPIHIEQLDSSEDNVTLLLGRNILLKIVEDQASKALLKDPLVEELIAVKGLCNTKIVKAIEELLAADNAWPEAGATFSNYVFDYALEPSSTVKAELDRTIFRSKHSSENSEQDTTAFVKGLNAVLTNKYFQAISSFQRTQKSASVEPAWRDREGKLLALEDQIKNLTGLELLEPTMLMICPHCGRELRIGEFRGKEKCFWCNNEANRTDVKRLPIHQVIAQIRKLWEKDHWFEAYLAKLLRKLDWKTWIKVNIMGSSGVSHEIDVLGIKGGNVIVVECKTGKVSRNDVFNFLTKTQDLKVHMGLLASLQGLPDPETRDFVKRNRLLVMLERMGEMSGEDILGKIKEALPA